MIWRLILNLFEDKLIAVTLATYANKTTYFILTTVASPTFSAYIFPGFIFFACITGFKFIKFFFTFNKLKDINFIAVL